MAKQGVFLYFQDPDSQKAREKYFKLAFIMSVYKKQIGGSHYKDMKIQPSEFINDNKLLFAEGNAIKYICRHAA